MAATPAVAPLEVTLSVANGSCKSSRSDTDWGQWEQSGILEANTWELLGRLTCRGMIAKYGEIVGLRYQRECAQFEDSCNRNSECFNGRLC